MRKNRVLIGVLGLDQHEVGAIGVAKILKDAGMEVVYTGMFNMPQSIVQTAIEEDVDLIGLSCHSWEYLHYLPELLSLLMEQKLPTPVVIGGSVVTNKDIEEVLRIGAAAAFGPSSSSNEIVECINRLINQRG